MHLNTAKLRNPPLKIRYSSRKDILVVTFIYMWGNWEIITDNTVTSDILERNRDKMEQFIS